MMTFDISPELSGNSASIELRYVQIEGILHKISINEEVPSKPNIILFLREIFYTKIKIFEQPLLFPYQELAYD